jgi:hypothetical protein
VEITPGLKDWVQRTHLLARGGGGSDPVMVPSLEPDWMNVPSRTTKTALEPALYDEWMDEGLKRGGWTVLMIHGLEGTTYGWEPITRANFVHILDGLKERKVWVGTFREVGAYFRAQKLFEGAKVDKVGPSTRWTWKVPEGFPQGTKLRAPSLGAGWELRQGEKVLAPDATGTCEFLFNKGELRAAPRADEKASTGRSKS